MLKNNINKKLIFLCYIPMALSILGKYNYVLEIVSHIQDPRDVYALMRVCKQMHQEWEPYLKDMYRCLAEVNLSSMTFKFSNPTATINVMQNDRHQGLVKKLATDHYLVLNFIIKYDFIEDLWERAKEKFNSVKYELDAVERVIIYTPANNIYEAFRLVADINKSLN